MINGLGRADFAEISAATWLTPSTDTIRGKCYVQNRNWRGIVWFFFLLGETRLLNHVTVKYFIKFPTREAALKKKSGSTDFNQNPTAVRWLKWDRNKVPNEMSWPLVWWSFGVKNKYLKIDFKTAKKHLLLVIVYKTNSRDRTFYKIVLALFLDEAYRAFA
jgi:hypothetical protein